MEIKRYNKFINEELDPNTYRSAARELDKQGFKDRAIKLREWSNRFTGDKSNVYQLYFSCNGRKEKELFNMKKSQYNDFDFNGYIDTIEDVWLSYFDPNIDMFWDEYNDEPERTHFGFCFSIGFNLINPSPLVKKIYRLKDEYGYNINAFNIAIPMIKGEDGLFTVKETYEFWEPWNERSSFLFLSNRKDAVKLKKEISDKFVPGNKQFDEFFDDLFEKGLMHKDELEKFNKVIKSIPVNRFYVDFPDAVEKKEREDMEKRQSEKEKIDVVNTTGDVRPIYKYKDKYEN